MTATKQQQLEWLAKHMDKWVHGKPEAYLMSVDEVGFVVGLATTISPVEMIYGRYHSITHEEWQQERDKMSSNPEVDNSWHERGELPPAGCMCEVLYGDSWISVFVIGVDAVGNCVFTVPQFLGVDVSYDGISNKTNFRPLRTDREKAIDDIASYFCDADGFQVTPYATDLIATRIYDAGYRKVKP